MSSDEGGVGTFSIFSSRRRRSRLRRAGCGRVPSPPFALAAARGRTRDRPARARGAAALRVLRALFRAFTAGRLRDRLADARFFPPARELGRFTERLVLADFRAAFAFFLP